MKLTIRTWEALGLTENLSKYTTILLVRIASLLENYLLLMFVPEESIPSELKKTF